MSAISPCFRGGAVSSLGLLAARFIDPRHQLRRQRTGVGSGYALSKLLSVLHTKHKSVDLKRQRVAMRQRGRSDINVIGQSPEAGRPGKIAHLGMVDRQESIDCTRQCSRLHRANTHHADPVHTCRGHDVAGFRGRAG